MPAEYDLSGDPHLRPGAPRSSAADNREVPARYCAGMNLQRISIVSYYRENMFKCGSAEKELEIVKSRKSLSGLNDGIA